MNLRKRLGVTLLLAVVSNSLLAEDLPFTLSITGEKFDIEKELIISEATGDKTKINFDFKNKEGENFNFDLKYKVLPSSRSYPSNLDVTVKDTSGNKLGYIFWANNGTKALKNLGTIGSIPIQSL